MTNVIEKPESKNANVINDNPLALELASAGVGIQSWSDDKRKAFVATFEARSRAARYILLSTAEHIQHTAERRKFITKAHTKKLKGVSWQMKRDLQDVDPHHTYAQTGTVGGRTISDLENIAEVRAKSVLEELPSLKAVVRIISADLAKKIERKELLAKQGQVMADTLLELSKPIHMKDMDQNMTIGQFREFVKQLERKRKDLINKLDELGTEGCELEDDISKELYAGIPGVSDAVIQVINDHIERATALDTTTRRVGERIMFGDSSEAMSLLGRFEKDEIEVSSKIKSEFAAALEKLKVLGKTKALPAKKRK